MRKMPTTLSAAMVALLVSVAAAAAGPEPLQSAVELNDKGKELLSEQKFEEALKEFAKAIEADGTLWEPYYQRGRALAMLGRMEDAKQSFLEGAEVNPAHAHNHLLAAIAAQNVGDLDTAWDQAIRAHLAGNADAQGTIDSLRRASEPPPDFEERMNAWAVFVAGVDTRTLLADADLPQDRAAAVNDPDAASARGELSVEQKLGQMQADLIALQRHVANAISDSVGFGLVPRLDMAEYVVTIVPEEIDVEPRASMEGYLRLYDVNDRDALYSRRVEFRDLASAGAVRSTLQLVMNQMENWKKEREQ